MDTQNLYVNKIQLRNYMGNKLGNLARKIDEHARSTTD